ncbi:MAG TPA: fasciclin domain-containing protein, partial [Candidatus Elarobacter sp.]|nr:fasciclin domain-containing protein [Candidatus Elarobacter sp.]
DTVVHVKQDTSVVTTTIERSGATPAPGSMTIAATLAQLPNYKTLTELLGQTHLLATLRGGAKFTLFAPTDDAFAKLTPAQLDALKSDTTRLRKLLLNHVVSGAIDTREILKLKTARTLEGSRIRLEYEGGHPTVNDNVIVQPGILASNGFIYGIAGVIGSP